MTSENNLQIEIARGPQPYDFGHSTPPSGVWATRIALLALEEAARICEQTFAREKEAGNVDKSFPDNAWSRICRRRIRDFAATLTPEKKL